MATSGEAELKAMAAPLDAILERVHNLEVQVRGIVTSQTVEAKAFVLRDDRGRIRARLDIQEYHPPSRSMTEQGRRV